MTMTKQNVVDDDDECPVVKKAAADSAHAIDEAMRQANVAFDTRHATVKGSNPQAPNGTPSKQR